MAREDTDTRDSRDSRATDGDHATTVERVFDAVAETAPEIRSGLPGRRSALDVENPSGETQLAADAHADQLLRERLGAIDGVASYVSEERESKVDASDGGASAADTGRVAVAVDPLDGSSNLRSNNAMGTIVGVYDAPLPASGRQLVGAGYLLYGPITTMVLAHSGVVREEVVASDPGDGAVDRQVVTPELVLPDDPVVYGFGGRVPDWTPEFAAFAEEIERELKLRYGGAMVGDVNQVLTYGGIFSYPALEDRPDGKLRLQFEANPMAFIVETAGGRSSTGTGSILDVEPETLHERTPVHLGNPELIERLEAQFTRA
ncbi:fructose-1,6-bisphosphatase I [Halalkaliarchaeum desulfuricum]|uniref:Fructose-1,6-bisphosphatase class 1 n=1 Tax=Halalkaliarchaeum desulfuricum TaxID=2055893 RepID=A0A343TLH6_9EURY|nr:class 1 fructose-bisphosphatase [Halalkaliarchaeum desulfuricum]AUX09948.1 fructose-1,6-bisphosphatase I [Halalkaliarchaeum desulfuricum]